MKRYTIYAIYNHVTKKFYVGMTSNMRQRRACHNSTNPACLDGPYTIREVACATGKANAVWAEAQVIKRLDSLEPRGYNVLNGRALPLWMKDFIGDTQRGNKSWLGRKHTDETRRKQSERRKAWLANNPHNRIGAPVSAETRRKISEANKGGPGWPGKRSDEMRARMRDAWTRRKERAQ